MIDPLIITLIATFVFIAVEFYIFEAIKVTFKNVAKPWRKAIYTVYWVFSISCILLYLVYRFAIPTILPSAFRTPIIVLLFINYFSKSFGLVFLIIDDLIRLFKWIYHTLLSFNKNKTSPKPTTQKLDTLTRSQFLSRAVILSTAIPAATMGFGILSGAHNYRIHRVKIKLANLPAAFHGIRIVQLSDIHSGSFFNKKAVIGGVEMVIAEKPDLVFFTGDIVNNRSSELNGYKDIFAKIHAPHGVFASLGNHDYGDYNSWPSETAKMQNLMDLETAYKQMGWRLLRNENVAIKEGVDELAVIGVENWGAGRFSKYGDMEVAMQGAEDKPVKLLLSHDPSHWDAQIRPDYKDIDIAFAGHTHGFQFGVEVGDFKWSPSQYIYKQWAGLYQQGQQYLYVNRGFGYIGYPGRIGIMPEITVFELEKS
ncbi:MAG: metallophosphoesterase [Cyclobacteriaceae bacterium]